MILQIHILQKPLFYLIAVSILYSHTIIKHLQQVEPIETKENLLDLIYRLII